MTWNKERYIEEVFNALSKERDVEKVIITFKTQSRDREGINLLKRDFLEPEIIEEYEEFKDGTIARELVEPIKENNYMWQKINRKNKK